MRRTFLLVVSVTLNVSSSLRIRDTVAVDTPARSAISFNVAMGSSYYFILTVWYAYINVLIFTIKHYNKISKKGKGFLLKNK